MKVKGQNINQAVRQTNDDKKNNPERYPPHPANEDIYVKYKESKDINPEDLSKKDELKRSYSDKDLSDTGLDIPGSELDDNQEDIGSEDEENNYYSLGGDDHDDLDEDRSEWALPGMQP